MARLHLLKSLSLVTGLFSTIWLIGISGQASLQAQPNSEDGNVLTAQLSPSRDRGAGLRGVQCNSAGVTPSMPKNEENVYLVELNASPTLLFEIPEIDNISGEIMAELLITDQDFNTVYVTPLEISNSPEGSELEIQLPNNLSVETGTNYYWKFAFICNKDGDRTADSNTIGILQFTVSETSPLPEE